FRWVNQRMTFLLAFLYFLEKGELIGRDDAAAQLGVAAKRSGGFHLDLEDYLCGLLQLASELSRFAINSVAAGDNARPFQIATFLADMDAKFRLLNLKNDNLRKRFDALKYDVQKVEHVVYDLTIRGLKPTAAKFVSMASPAMLRNLPHSPQAVRSPVARSFRAAAKLGDHAKLVKTSSIPIESYSLRAPSPSQLGHSSHSYVNLLLSPVGQSSNHNFASPELTPSVEFSATRNCRALVHSPFRQSSFRQQRRRLYRDGTSECSSTTSTSTSARDDDTSVLSTSVPEKSVNMESALSSPMRPMAVDFQRSFSFCRGDIAAAATPLLTEHPKSALPAPVAKLGKGGFGAVFAGHYDGKRVAIKQLHSKILRDGARHDSLRAELNAFKLKHPNIVRILTFTSCGATIQVVYEYVGKRNLQSVLDDHDGEVIDSNRRMDICTQVADALCFCHSHKVLHLDVKPANVLLTDDGRTWKLADFGCSRNLIAADVHTPNTPASTASTANNAAGTLLYKAPELLKGNRASTKADVYSYSLLAWQCMSRRAPYDNLHAHTAVFLIVAQMLRPDTLFVREGDSAHLFNDADRQLMNLIERCWCPAPESRPEFTEICLNLATIGLHNMITVTMAD
uniref:Translin n=1 Tax=Plectus sambesii TaxID=2011161 RepID=A0A914WUU3_9BILA